MSLETANINHVLVLEDRPTSQKWLCQAVGEAFDGAQTQAVGTLAAARAISDTPFDLALIDLDLPDGSGIDLIRELSAGQPHCRLVVATIYDDDEHLFAALRAGAEGYLLKDQSLQSIARLLRGLTRGEAPLSPGIAKRLLAAFRQSTEASPPDQQKLTARERDVLQAIAQGRAVVEAAQVLGISANTVAYHVKNIYQKLRINNRAQAVREATRLGLMN